MSARLPVVTLDGPAGVGKTTLARRVAEGLGLSYLDTGAMFRCMALKLGAGFVPVRKPGKLPGKVDQQSFALEYGDETLAIHSDALWQGARVMVIDDVLATGGTLVQDGEGFSCVSTDSRRVEQGCLFIPLVGERFDGHTYLTQALESGAAGCLCSRLPEALVRELISHSYELVRASLTKKQKAEWGLQ